MSVSPVLITSEQPKLTSCSSAGGSPASFGFSTTWPTTPSSVAYVKIKLTRQSYVDVAVRRRRSDLPWKNRARRRRRPRLKAARLA